VTRTRAAPYHDLRLADPIRDPAWLERFEAWMTQRQVTRSARKGETGRQSLGRVVSASARNHYRSAMSGLYRAALRPQYRGRTGVTRNPWLDVERDRPRRRTARLTAEQIAAWIAEASPHVRLALAIGVLAPKLRASNILALEWRDVDFAHKVIVIRAPKIAHLTGQEQVAPLSPALEQILQRAHARRGTCPNVIAWRDEPVQDIKRGLQGAAERAGVPFGLAIGGATFHTLRHYAATVLAALGVPEGLRKDTMGHREIRTTQIYTHLMPEHERGPLALLAEATPLGESVGVILGGREKWTREKSGRFARFPRAVTSPKRARKAR
jgi:integrase